MIKSLSNSSMACKRSAVRLRYAPPLFLTFPPLSESTRFLAFLKNSLSFLLPWHKLATLILLISLIPGCTIQKIYAINDYINSYNYIPDTVNYTKKPEQFFKDGGGDCEDFANAKYHALLAAGIPANQMRFVVIPIEFPVSHMMLEVEGYLLDNRTHRIIPSHYIKTYPARNPNA